MKIEVIECSYEQFNEKGKCSGSTCFEAKKFVHDAISGYNGIYGIIIIDEVPVKFYYSPLANDGNIFTADSNLHFIIKSFIPLYVYLKHTK